MLHSNAMFVLTLLAVVYMFVFTYLTARMGVNNRQSGIWNQIVQWVQAGGKNP